MTWWHEKYIAKLLSLNDRLSVYHIDSAYGITEVLGVESKWKKEASRGGALNTSLFFFFQVRNGIVHSLGTENIHGTNTSTTKCPIFHFNDHTPLFLWALPLLDFKTVSRFWLSYVMR